MSNPAIERAARESSNALVTRPLSRADMDVIIAILERELHYTEMLEALKEINQHLRDVVETQKNGDRNNWEGYYVPEFAKLSQKFTELIAHAEGKK